MLQGKIIMMKEEIIGLLLKNVEKWHIVLKDYKELLYKIEYIQYQKYEN